MNSDIAYTISMAFKVKKLLSRNELLIWLKEVYPDASTETLTWRIHNLKSKGILESPGRALYRLATKSDFTPIFSNLSKRIAVMLAKELPLVKVCIWETRWLNNWMEFQPAYNWTIVEAEKDALDAVFNQLTGLSKKVYLQPDRTIMELYVLSLNEAIIVKPLVSEAPLAQEGKITTASLEKILVDIVADSEIFAAQQGELAYIFEAIFSQLLVHQNRLLRYARRRKQEEKVFSFIPEDRRLPNINPKKHDTPRNFIR